MAWLEKKESEKWHVRVVEQRGRTVWERVARGRRNARGRVRLVAELATEPEASATYRNRVTELEADGYVTIDPTAGVDALHPRTEATKTGPRAPPKPGIDDFVRDLTKDLDALPERPRLRDVLRVLDARMRAPRAFRTKGFVCDLTLRDQARVVATVKSVENYWREVGFSATIDVPDELDTSEDCIEFEACAWSAFVADLVDDASWQTVEDLRCVKVEVVDDEID